MAVSIDQMPVAFKCPACGKVARTTGAYVLRQPLTCPLCKAEIEEVKIRTDVKRSRENFSRTVKELEGGNKG